MSCPFAPPNGGGGGAADAAPAPAPGAAPAPAFGAAPGAAAGAATTTRTGQGCYYGAYLKLDNLLTLQEPISRAHEEMLFIVTHQAYVRCLGPTAPLASPRSPP